MDEGRGDEAKNPAGNPSPRAPPSGPNSPPPPPPGPPSAARRGEKSDERSFLDAGLSLLLLALKNRVSVFSFRNGRD